MSRRFASKRLAFESLEDRCLMAGLTASVDSSGNLIVSEAVGSQGGMQSIEVMRMGDQKIGIKGVTNQDGTSTVINGELFTTFAATGDIVLNLGGGNDRVVFNVTTYYNGLTINMGPNTQAKADNDYLYMGNIRTSASVSINTGVGNDTVIMQDTQIGDSYFDNLIVKMGAGADIFTMRGVNQAVTVKGNFNLYMFDNAAEADIDTATLSNVTLVSNHVVSTGGGSDTIDYRNVTIGGDMLLHAGAGHDTAKLNNVQTLDDFFGYMGEGDDRLDLTNVSADEMELYGEAGFDTYNRINAGYVRRSYQSGFETGSGNPVL